MTNPMSDDVCATVGVALYKSEVVPLGVVVAIAPLLTSGWPLGAGPAVGAAPVVAGACVCQHHRAERPALRPFLTSLFTIFRARIVVSSPATDVGRHQSVVSESSLIRVEEEAEL